MKAEGKQSYRGETPKRPTPVPPTWEVTQEKHMKTYENLGASSNQRQDKFKIVSPSRYACGVRMPRPRSSRAGVIWKPVLSKKSDTSFLSESRSCVSSQTAEFKPSYQPPFVLTSYIEMTCGRLSREGPRMKDACGSTISLRFARAVDLNRCAKILSAASCIPWYLE